MLRPLRIKRAAFSLVEVTLAIGIVAFAFVGLMGLLPTGLTTFRRSINTTVGTQIADRLLNEAQQTDFSVLANGQNALFIQPNPTSTTAGNWRYFDDQGNELADANNAIYQVQTLINPVTTLPYSSNGPVGSNSNLATVTLQIANNPGGRTLQTDSTTKLLTDTTVPISTYTGTVSRNNNK